MYPDATYPDDCGLSINKILVQRSEIFSYCINILQFFKQVFYKRLRSLSFVWSFKGLLSIGE